MKCFEHLFPARAQSDVFSVFLDETQARRFLLRMNLLLLLAHSSYSACFEYLNSDLALEQQGYWYACRFFNLLSMAIALAFLAVNKWWLEKNREKHFALARLFHLLVFNLLGVLINIVRHQSSATQNLPDAFFIGGFILISYLMTVFYVAKVFWAFSASIFIAINGVLVLHRDASPEGEIKKAQGVALAIAYSAAFSVFLLGTLLCFSSREKLGRSSQEILEELIKHLHLGVIILDANKKITFANNKMFKIFGIKDASAKELQGSLDSQLFETYKKVGEGNTLTSTSRSWGSRRQGPSYLQENTVPFKSLFELVGKKFYTYVLEKNRKKSLDELLEGHEIYKQEMEDFIQPMSQAKDLSKFKSYKVKVSNLSKDLSLKLVTFLDVTEAKLISEVNNNKIYKENLLKSFSHELKTPLNNAQSMLQCALRDAGLTSEIKEKYLRHPINSIHLLSLLIHDIIDFLKLEANQFKLDIQEFGPRSLLKEVLDLVELKAREKGLTVELKIEHDLPQRPIRSDRERLLRILTNFALNCIKFTFQGSVKISAESQRLDTHSEDSKLIISIADTRNLKASSSGIMEGRRSRTISGVQEEIYELGLLINRHLIDALLPQSDSYKCIFTESGIIHRIAIAFESEKGLQQTNDGRRRSTVAQRKSHFFHTSSIPTIPERSVCSEPEHFHPLPSKACRSNISLIGKPKRDLEKCVLIVDDEAYNLLSLEMLLQREGLTVLKALNGNCAIELVQSFPKFDERGGQRAIVLALMDLNMPVMDGFECSSFLLELMEERQIDSFPIYACSANDSNEYQEKCKQLGMSGFIAKPLTSKCLHQILNTI